MTIVRSRGSPARLLVPTKTEYVSRTQHSFSMPVLIVAKSDFALVLQDNSVIYTLHKVCLPYKNNQYEWELTGSQGELSDAVVLKHGDIDYVAKIETSDGACVVTLEQGGFYTLNRFRWGSKTYRYCCPLQMHTSPSIN